MAKFDYTHGQVFFRNSFMPFKEANLNIASSPVLYGLSIYTVCSAQPNPDDKKLYLFRLRDHYKRLENSAKIMDFHAFARNWPYEKFEATLIELLRRNDIKEPVLIRATVFIDELLAGTKIHDLTNSFSAFVYPFVPILRQTGIAACVSSWTRTADNAIPSRAKVNGSYINSSLMKNEALLNGYDEAIAVDEHGHVSEGTVANIFIIRDGQLITPDAATDMLEGITRDSVIELGKMMGLPVVERSIDRSELYIADEVFMCGSSAQVTPVISIDKRQIAHGRPGPITQRIGEAYKSAQTGAVAAPPGWLTTA